MRVVHKPDSQLVRTGTAPCMSITSNMMSVSAAARPCANLQEERTYHTGWLLLGCSRAQWINCLHGLMATPSPPGLRCLGLWPRPAPQLCRRGSKRLLGGNYWPLKVDGVMSSCQPLSCPLQCHIWSQEKQGCGEPCGLPGAQTLQAGI